MKLKICDVVLIMPLGKKGLVMSYAHDINDDQYKYLIHISDEEPDCICNPGDLKLISTLGDEFEKFAEENTPQGKA